MGNTCEDRLQAQVFALGLRNLGLQKLLIRIGLQFDEVRRGDDLFDFTEVNSFCYCSRWHVYLFTMARLAPVRSFSTKRHEARALPFLQRTCQNSNHPR